MSTLENFRVFKSLTVGPPQLEPKRVKTAYRLTTLQGEVLENELIYTYQEQVFDKKDAHSLNLASMVGAQVAINYGLFCEELTFDGLFDESDQRFIKDMCENTSREIYVNKLLAENEFIKAEYLPVILEKRKRYTQAQIRFINSRFADQPLEWRFAETYRDEFAILSSGGKDSLLSYGLIRSMKKEAHPMFINESGRHWFTAINAHRFFEGAELSTVKVWCNSDRLFNWMLRQMPFIKPNFADIRSDIYPIRLWTVAVFLFGVLPLVRKRKIGNVLVGDEYDTTVRLNHQGITHYAGLFDQSKYFDNAMSRYYLKKGWNMSQYSLLRSMSELLIMKTLVKSYPTLQQHQVSCHASHEKDGRIYPCGNCEKCRRIVGMLIALDENPERCGYTPEQIQKALKNLESKSVKQIGPDATHLYHLLLDKKAIAKNTHTSKLAKAHDYILKLRFDNERSMTADLPPYIREPLFMLLLEHSDGAVKMTQRKWEPIDLMASDILHQPYHFDATAKTKAIPRPVNSEFLWEKLTWPEIEERLKEVDTAILPCGAIEQHGPHLPVDIDYFDAVYLSHQVAKACSDPKPFVLPPIPYGVSYHHQSFKGTLSVTNDALSRFVYDIGMTLAKNGIKKLIIINGHGDNAPTLSYAAQMINRDAEIFVCVDTGETSDVDLYHLIETPNDIHAGEIETSTTLAIRPESVRMEKAVNETLRFGTDYLDFTSDRGVSWYVQTDRISESGIMGDPTRATAEKGKKMWDIMVAHLVRFVEEIKKRNLEELYQKRY